MGYSDHVDHGRDRQDPPPPFNVDWNKTLLYATINIASSIAMNNPELKELPLETIAKVSCNLADSLINELKKENHGKDRI